ncbi:RNA 2',3'-cyclic phosphodiesterase [Marinobacter caseinilyticus]|uniref:RNA 2',3'-cyclic phosphodiesterase n=1 Tax=Marinobacter caseinilyticus TaxID=2692195 RepID=UPI0014090D0B|nr:RNA 2',3'-cyclic phosphodiesterase [Marinobacter caseinilyticus]
MPRLFIGLELPDTLTEALLSLHCDIPGARWQSAGQLHLTLCFTGNVDDATAQAVQQCLARVEAARFDIALQRIGCQGNPHHPRTLWTGVTPRAPLAALNQRIGAQLEAIGLPPDTRRYRPHVTLARFRKNAGSVADFLAANADQAWPPFTVTEFTLFQSTLSPEGSHYNVVERFALVPED